MARPRGSKTGKGYELARRWAAAFGSSPVLTREVVGPNNPFPEFKTVQAIERTMSLCGFTLERTLYDGKSKLYSLSPKDVDRIQGLNEEE